MNFSKFAELLTKAAGEAETEKVEQLMRVYFDSLPDKRRAKFLDRVSRMSRDELTDRIVKSFKRKPDYNSAHLAARVLYDFYLLYKQSGNLKFIHDIKREENSVERSSAYNVMRYRMACTLPRTMSEEDIVKLICAYEIVDQNTMLITLLALDSSARRDMAARAADLLKTITLEYQGMR